MTKDLFIAEKVVISRKDLKAMRNYEIKSKKKQKNNLQNKYEIIAKIIVDILNDKEFLK